jgi:uncharacterized protein (UPF0248 family)
MQPIHELLNQIRWDPSYQGSRFEIGYYDRIRDEIIRVPLQELNFPSDDHFDFQLLDEEGELHRIPLHRIKDVYRDGELIWHREH